MKSGLCDGYCERDGVILMKIMLAFFDLDGTLSAPQYREADGTPVIGFTPKRWMEYCERERDHAYRDCRPVAEVAEFAKELYENGTLLKAHEKGIVSVHISNIMAGNISL